MLEKQKGESPLAYHRRLIEGKLVDKTLADIDYSELSSYVYGQEYNSDVARRMMYGSQKTLQLIDEQKAMEAKNSGYGKEFDAKMAELQKERQRFFDQRSAFNRVIRERSRAEEINDIITRAVTQGDLPSLPHPEQQMIESDCDLLVSLNDLHYGIEVDNYWGKYNSDICATMVSNYLAEVFRIAERHKAENCIVWANGDLISGNIHSQIQAANRENVIEQIMGVSELIAQFLVALSERFREVKFVSVAGNHSRIAEKDRALLGERLDDLAEWYLKARLAGHDNIIVGFGEKIDTTMYAIDVRGKTYIGVHGDYDRAANKAQTLRAMTERPVYAIISGHLHHNSHDYEQGIKTFMAGSFLGIDDYCISKRIYSKPEQMVLVCDNNGVQCTYDVPLAKS